MRNHGGATRAGCPVVVGTTGWEAARPEVGCEVLALDGAMLAAPNLSLGANAFLEIAEYAALRSLVEWQIEDGVDFLVPIGSTGEAATLTPAEQRRVVEVVVERAGGRVPVVAGAGSNDTRRAVAASRAMREIGVTHLLHVFDLVHERVYRASEDSPLEIPPNAVVVPGSRSVRGGWGSGAGARSAGPGDREVSRLRDRCV